MHQKKDIFMENKKPLVLISNDDGYHANGIKTLVNFLKDWCDLLVVALKVPARDSPVPSRLLLPCA